LFRYKELAKEQRQKEGAIVKFTADETERSLKHLHERDGLGTGPEEKVNQLQDQIESLIAQCHDDQR
jgi:hypothetical protein